MPGCPSDCLDIGARKLVGTCLLVPEIEIIRDWMHRLRNRGIGAFRYLDCGRPKTVDGCRSIHFLSGLQDGHLETPFGEVRRDQCAGNT